MRNLAKCILAVVIWQAVANSAFAEEPMPAFVKVSMSGSPVDLGTHWGPGDETVGANLSAHVVANCPFRIAASFRGFVHEEGKGALPPWCQLVKVNGKSVPVGNRREVIVQSDVPTPSGVDVPIGLQIHLKGLKYYPAGRYNGMLVLTVMAGP
jgi:hypothetical protein